MGIGLAAARLFADNLRRYLAGKPLLNVVDKALGYFKKEELSQAEQSYAKAHELMVAQGWGNEAASVLDTIKIQSDDFSVEPELTAKIARQRCRIYEVPISYSGRDYSEGKKIGWKDGFQAIYCIIRYGIAD